ncbi:hypothetical protein SAMD00019534_009970 [Acytostelium subglobosum LB1]|uniref:hypothetical protein n=1 Tax=Acytostelium subglobosum LB1 TaxID=1410327 RepID=UPI0006448263|nr:hypothetical protein SAMD00019534_009970 [Acytostelium subglobosum LB1]GAM17822.1 hypothetical protein SAMD00019534_009970 [Acytostelium subglobosum LB1]|eukprot:XP_012758418.1 hypothetical protein SAMD00019534_009970 [Acytostelium subglobosum LB1]
MVDVYKRDKELDVLDRQKSTTRAKTEELEKRAADSLIERGRKDFADMLQTETTRMNYIDEWSTRCGLAQPNTRLNKDMMFAPMPAQSNPHLREMREIQQQAATLQKNIHDLFHSAANKEEHLLNLISDMETKIVAMQQQVAEKQKTTSKKETDALVARLEAEGSKDFKVRDIIKNIHVAFKCNNPSDHEIDEPAPPATTTDPRSKTPVQAMTGTSKSMLIRHQSTPKLMSKSTPNLPEIANKAALSPDLTALVAQTKQYPITLNLSGELHYSVYSVELDTIESLRHRFFKHLQSTAAYTLAKMEIGNVDQLSLKTSSHTFFSNEPKIFVKYIPYFADHVNQSNDHSLNPVIYIVSNKQEQLINNQISLIIENYNESLKTTNQESIYFRTKMIDFLEAITRQRKKLDGDLKSYRTPMSSFIRVRSVTNPLPSRSFNHLSRSLSPQAHASFLATSPPSTSSSSSRPLEIAAANAETNNSNDDNISKSVENVSILSSSGSWKSCSPSNRAVPPRTGADQPSSPVMNNHQMLTMGHAGTCNMRIFISENIIKTFQCHIQTAAGELIDSLYSKYAKIIQITHKLPESKSSVKELKMMFVVKIRGVEIYLLNQSIPLSSIDYINTRSRRQKKIDLILVPKQTLDLQHLQLISDYSELSKLHSRESLEIELDDDKLDHSTPNLSYSVTKNFRLRVGGLKNFPVDNFPSLASALPKSPKLYISCQMYQCGYKIGQEMLSPQIALMSNPSWLSWVEGTSYNHIPSNTTMLLQIKVKIPGVREDAVLGWVNFRLWNYQNRLNSGFHCLRTWSDSKPNPIGSLNENTDQQSNPISLSFEVEMSSPPIIFAPLPPGKESSRSGKDEPSLTIAQLQHLTTIIEKDPLTDLTQDELDLCWRHRHYCKTVPKSASKVILSVPWNSPECVQDLYQIMHDWLPLDPVDTLELLSSKFLDGEVRKFAITTLRRMSDSELTLYLPQLVQALKHEPNHYSVLAKFLLRRVLLNRQQMGHLFFWQIVAEISNLNRELHAEWVERYTLILESFLKGSGNRLQEIHKQFDLYQMIKGVAIGVKTVPNTKRKDYITTSLSNLKLANDFQLPINPEFSARGIEVSACKIKESKTLPLWLSFINSDPLGDNILTIFKAGDDLRQDQLTLQMIDLMDRMWLSEGIDLQTISYKCITTGPFEGMIEVVGESVTIAEIQKLSGGIAAAFSETAIDSWLKQVNPSEFEYKLAVENFVRSCAGCCVYTFILGIGDRHNDNIMITKSGHLFHIDFGRFLGNVQTWNGIKRERSPFVFPRSFAHIIGEHFKTFEDLCGKAYNIIRKKAHMVSTGMPELNHRDDIKYLRDALALDLTQEQAAVKFSEMIQESLKAKATGVNFAVHILANPN